MKKITKTYRQNTKENIFGIQSILKALRMKEPPPLLLYEDILKQSSSQIVSNWLSGRKYCRTFFVQKAFGKSYPVRHIQFSLCVDVIVNILDDLLDEKLDKATKTNYIIEILRIFSIYAKESPPKIHNALGKYFNKLITLAIAENFYQEKVVKKKDINKVVEDSCDLLMCRGMDIDVFIEIALLKSKNQKSAPAIRKIGRLFRAINILKKDIKDIKHDKENRINTIVTLVLGRGRDSFSAYITNLLNLFLEKVNKIEQTKNKQYLQTHPIYKFKKMIKEEKKEILKIIKFL